MSERKGVFSESLEGNRSHVDDGMFGLSGEEGDLTALRSQVTARGVIFTTSCSGDARTKTSGCGKQLKAVLPWGEILAWYSGTPVQGSVATRQGVISRLSCRCGDSTPILIDWEEVRQWLAAGVRSGAVPQTAMGARR